MYKEMRILSINYIIDFIFEFLKDKISGWKHIRLESHFGKIKTCWYLCKSAYIKIQA